MRRAFPIVVVLLSCGKAAPPPPDPQPPTAPSDATLLEQRPYSAHVPMGLPDAGSTALIVVLGGFGEASSVEADYMGFTALSDAKGVLLATPNGTWHVGTSHYPHWDVEYVRAVIRDMESKYSIDPKQVFVAGHSLGAHMAYRMACDDADDVTQIMVMAGQSPTNAAGCRLSQPVAVMAVHGDDDDVIGYNGDVQNNPPDPSVPSAHESVAAWASFDRCDGGIADAGTWYDFDSTLPGDDTSVEKYSGCANNTSVELWTIHGGSHGPAFNDTFAPTVWDFWMKHLRP